MYLPILGTSVATWRRGMPGIPTLGKLFFKKIRLKLRRRSKHFVATHVRAAMAARNEFVLVRIRRDDRGAAGRQPQNKSPIRGDTDNPSAHGTGAAVCPGGQR